MKIHSFAQQHAMQPYIAMTTVQQMILTQRTGVIVFAKMGIQDQIVAGHQPNLFMKTSAQAMDVVYRVSLYGSSQTGDDI